MQIYFRLIFLYSSFFCTGLLIILSGTVRSNRVCGAVLPENLKRVDSISHFDTKNEALITRWKDNANVTVLTNFEPQSNAKRYDRKVRAEATFKMPHVIKEYNACMGGVDLHDNAIANFRIGIRGKKWWWPLFTNLLGNMMVSACIGIEN